MSTPTPPTVDPIRLALPSKGHLYDGVVEILKTAGYKVRRASDRQYEATIAGHPRFHVVFMRPTDIVTQVEEGRCHLGVTGMDVFAERAAEAEQAAWSSSRPRLRRLPAGRRRARELDRRHPHHRPGRPDRRVQGRGQDLPRLDQVPRADAGLLPQVGHLLLPVDRLRRRPRAAPEPGDRRHHRRPDQLGDDAEGQPPPRDRAGDRPRLGLLPDRPRPEPRGAGRGGRDRPAGPAARRDGRRPGLGGDAPPGGRRQPRRARPRDGRRGGRLPRASRGPSTSPGARSGTTDGAARLAGHRPDRRPEADRLPARTCSGSGPAGSSASPPGSSSTATATPPSTPSESAPASRSMPVGAIGIGDHVVEILEELGDRDPEAGQVRLGRDLLVGVEELRLARRADRR